MVEIFTWVMGNPFWTIFVYMLVGVGWSVLKYYLYLKRVRDKFATRLREFKDNQTLNQTKSDIEWVMNHNAPKMSAAVAHTIWWPVLMIWSAIDDVAKIAEWFLIVCMYVLYDWIYKRFRDELFQLSSKK